MLDTVDKICSECYRPYTVLKNFENDSDKCFECSGLKNKLENKNSPLEVTIKPELLDLSNIEKGEGSQEYRPSNFNEYIGQEEAKEKAIKFIEGCQKFSEFYPHTFICGFAGTGKTLFATILSNMLKKKIVFTTGGELKNEQIFIDKVTESNGGVIFIDEANKIAKKVGFFMLPLIEQFKISGQNLKRFTVIFASTHIGDISKDLDALISRCDIINLRPYTNEELFTIVKQYNNKQYSSSIIPEKILNNITLNCRQNPRLGKNLVRAYVYIQDWEKVKKFNQIIFEGLTSQDFKVLEYLSQYDGVGKNSIANYLRIKPQTYEWELEPYLIYKNLIVVSNRRKITEKGKEFLIKMKKEIKNV